jgi:hypothetical protein
VETNENISLKGRTLLFKFQLTFFFFFLITQLSIVSSQFDFQRIKACYGITILNEKGEKISFKTDSTYIVKIDGRVYNSPKAPALSVKEFVNRIDSTINTKPNVKINYSSRDQNYNPPKICSFIINDLTPPIYESEKAQLEIIHGSDTLFLTTGYYNYELKFGPGHYYIPIWVREIYEQKPKASRDIRFMNLDQRNFIVSKADYDHISKSQDLKWLDDQIANRFIEGYFTVDKYIDSIQFNQQVDNYQLQHFHRIYPTSNKDIYTGFIRCIHKSSQHYNFIPCVLNTKENSIILKPYRNDLTAYKFHWIFADTLNKIYYQTLSGREPSDSLYFSKYRIPFFWNPIVLKSLNGGESWMKDTLLTSLLDKNVRYHLSLHDKGHSGSVELDHYLDETSVRLLFLDKSHIIVSFNLRTYFNNTDVKQGLYYLLKNGHLIDSCISPQLDFTDFVSDYSSVLTKDTVMVGSWYIRSDYETPESDFTQLIVKEKDRWRFRNVCHNQRHDPKKETKPEQKHQNFEITGENTIYFGDGLSLTTWDKVTSIPDWYRSPVLENGNQIYILNRITGTTWISFDKGKSWYFYPKIMDELSSEYDIIEAENGVISIFNATKLTKTRFSFREISK